jgi:hypothetical protein
LPVVAPLFAFVAARLGALAWRGEPSSVSDRAVAGVVLAFGSAILGIRLLGLAHAIVPATLLALLVATAAALAFVAPRLAARPARPDLGTLSVLLVAAAALVTVTVAALLLPVWQWDSLGYHLPFVHFTLGARSPSGVPHDLEYIGSYPHDVELFFVALRACLPDDRLIDLGQLPFGIAGAIVTAALARREGASQNAALVAGAAWLFVPVVFLQLPTDYVDVATASFLLAALYFVLAPPSPRSIALAGVALGLFVGSQPSAPVPCAVLFVLLAARAWKSGYAREALFALTLVVLFGGESYAENIVWHHNPVWPLRVDLCPLHPPVLHPMSEMLSAGAAAPHLTGPLPLRMARTLFALTAAPTFDMRIGGFGALLVCALPFAVVRLVRQKSVVLWVALASTLMSPDPAIARYVLAFPAFVLALAAPAFAGLSSRHQTLIAYAVAVLGAVTLVYAAPGLHGEGPPLLAYASMSEDERALAVGADGPPLVVAKARGLVGAGEAFAFDENMDLSDLAWDARQSYRVVFLPPALEGEAVARALADDNVRVLVVGDHGPAGAWAATHPLQFEKVSALSSCRNGTCSLFVRR